MLLEILIGAVVGLLVGMSGLGGPMLFVPLIILLFKYKTAEAVGIALSFITLTKLVALVGHYKEKNINFHIAKYFLIGSLPASIIVSHLINNLHRNPVKAEKLDMALMLIIGVALIIFSGLFLLESTLNYHKRQRQLRFTQEQKLLAIAIGVLIGMDIGATSIGAASILALFMALTFKVKSVEIVGTDIFITMIVSGLSGFVYLLHGAVTLGAVIPFLIGSIPLALIGTRLSHLAKGKPLRALISLIVFAGGMMLLYNTFA